MGAQFFRNSPRYDVLEYTKRQQDIIDGIMPMEQIRRNELAAIMKKAEARFDEETVETVQSIYDIMDTPESCIPKYGLEEAKEILQSLTPWKINWDI